MEIFILILLYMVSVVIGYFSTRRMVLDLDTDPDLVMLVVMFVPIANVVWSCFVWIEHAADKGIIVKMLRKFFRV